MPERLGVVEGKSMTACSRRGWLRTAGAIPYCGVVEVSTGMRRFLVIAVCAGALSLPSLAQDTAATDKPATPPPPAKGTTLIGCLAGPDADDRYTLTNMQHRLGVEVVGGDDLLKGAGAKVKLTGSWEPLPGVVAKKGDESRRFKATEVSVMEEKCQAPSPTTPVSKKKQAEKKQQSSRIPLRTAGNYGCFKTA